MEKGGAILAMTGYESSNTYEIAPTNQLLAFSGIQVAADDLFGSGAAQFYNCTSPCPSAATKVCCKCWGTTLEILGWDATHPASANIKSIPVRRGRSIVSPADGQVVATQDGKVMAVAKQVGAGRVFVFGDEWVSYTSQWGTSVTATTDPDCVDPATAKPMSAATRFQVPQFWYNVIRWLQPDLTCFKVDDSSIIL
jgi:hypothetical protein